MSNAVLSDENWEDEGKRKKVTGLNNTCVTSPETWE